MKLLKGPGFTGSAGASVKDRGWLGSPITSSQSLIRKSFIVNETEESFVSNPDFTISSIVISSAAAVGTGSRVAIMIKESNSESSLLLIAHVPL
ncbi:MAG: hypothetical protein ACOX8S_02965 [Christensenellales bacterium]